MESHKVRKKDGAVAVAVRRLFDFGDVAQARKGAKEMCRGLKSKHPSLGMHQGMIISSCHYELEFCGPLARPFWRPKLRAR